MHAKSDIYTLKDVQLSELSRHIRADGEVVVAELPSALPFAAARLFTVTAPRGAERGRHAHRLCFQFMISVCGAIDIVCDDGRDQRKFQLDRHYLSLIVPPTIWSTVTYREADSVLVVLCDRLYEANDYIRDYEEFLRFRSSLT